MANQFDFRRVQIRLKEAEKGLSLSLANVAKNDFLNNFREQGFNGQKWREVQRRIAGTKAYSGNKDLGKRTRAILQGKGSGRLRKDVANSVSNGIKNSELSYTLIVNNEYASFHNDGTKRIPQRQFVGMTEKLNKKLLNKINEKFSKIW
jgi:phage gpG-like protein